MPKSKNFKAYNQALAIGFQGKKNLGQFDFSVGGKSQFCDSGRKKCKICYATQFQSFSTIHQLSQKINQFCHDLLEIRLKNLKLDTDRSMTTCKSYSAIAIIEGVISI